MAAKNRLLPVSQPIVTTFLIFAVIAFMSLASEVLKPLALAILLSFALAPIAKFLEQFRVPRFLAVVLTLLLALGVMGAVGYKVGEQLTTLARHVNPEQLQTNIRHKFRFLQPKEEGAIERLLKTASNLAQTFDPPPSKNGAVPVNVVTEPSFTQRLQSAVGPYLESVGVGAFVLVLVLFILANREDLCDRVIRLVGQGRVSLTTKTMEEVGRRISRYLIMFATVNSTFGLIVSLGLWQIGVPLAAIWGFLAGILRFIPYVGPATAFVLPFLFSVANFEGWREPLMVAGLFAVMEVLANSVIEPVIYGKTTGVSSLGLLVAAMFWTWLWGAMGLLLSTPMTVCLAVLGKSVPGLRVFATLLGEEEALEPGVRFYQRLLARDPDGASEILETALKQSPVPEVFDRILIPTLARVERDFGRDELDMRERAFILRFVSDIIEDLSVDNSAETTDDKEKLRILGVRTNNRADILVLKMLSSLLSHEHLHLKIVAESDSPLKLAEKIARFEPQIVMMSYLPSGGFTRARYLVKRLRAQFPGLPIVVGRWGEFGDLQRTASRLVEMGATKVVYGLTDATETILRQLNPDPEGNPTAGGLKSTAMETRTTGNETVASLPG